MPGKGTKIHKEMWNWDWKKLRNIGKDKDDKEPEGDLGESEPQYQYPVICVINKNTTT